MLRFSLATLLCGLLVAQQPAPKSNSTKSSTTRQAQTPGAPKAGDQTSPEDEFPDQDLLRFTVGAEYVVAPVVVFDRDGAYVNGLRPEQFRLFDNGKEQNIQVDVTYDPISLVLCVQANSKVEGLLPQVKKIGNLIQPLITGDQGEVALIAYDGRPPRVLQEFTNDSNKITEEVKKLFPGSSQNRLIDAVVEGTRMLRNRPKNRRRIILAIGETRDVGSASRAREALIGLQIQNVVFYSVDMSRFMTTLTAPTPVGRPDTLPPAMHPLPAGVPATPTTVAQTYGYNGGRAEFVPLMVELFKDAKAIFKDNPVELFTKGTGGSEFGFHSQRTLEEAMTRVGEELHSQYMISYAPNNREEMGFHEIVVQVPGRPDVKKVQTRPGYWLAPKR
jgi:VWFA-related protein